MSMWTKLGVSAAMVLALAGVPALQGGVVDSAAVYQIEDGDGIVDGNGDPDIEVTAVGLDAVPRVSGDANTYQHDIVWLFELEDMASATSANVSLGYRRDVSINPTDPASGGSLEQTVALYVSNTTRDSAEATEDDYIAPGNDPTPDTSAWTLLQLDFVVGEKSGFGTPPGTNVSLSAAGQANLLAVLNDIYAGGYEGGKYIAIAAVEDSNGVTGTHDRFEFTATGGKTDKDTDEFVPHVPGGHYQLEVVPVPEPATMGLLGLGGLVALRRRRR